MQTKMNVQMQSRQEVTSREASRHNFEQHVKFTLHFFEARNWEMLQRSSFHQFKLILLSPVDCYINTNRFRNQLAKFHSNFTVELIIHPFSQITSNFSWLVFSLLNLPVGTFISLFYLMIVKIHFGISYQVW